MINYRTAFISALILHSALLGYMIFNMDLTTHKRQPVLADNNPVPVHAVTIDQNKLNKQIKDVKLAEQRKHNAENARVKKLENQMAAAKRKTQVEQKRLAELAARRKKDAAQQKIAQAKAKQELAKVKATQAKETKQLEKLAKERESLELDKQVRKEADELLAKQMAEEQKEMNAAHQRQVQTEVEKYTALISHAIGQNWILPDNADGSISCVLLIHLAPGGSVVDVQLVTSSGDGVLDRSATSAVYKASPLPVPDDSELFDKFREIRLRVKPEGYLL